MKTLHLKFLSLFLLVFLWMNNTQTFAQSASYAGNWQSTSPIASMNNSILKIKILSTSDPNVFIIVNAASPKKKINAKYDQTDSRLYATVKSTPIYFVYVPATDSLECYKSSNNSKLCDLNRY
jgi:hypothetical protein